MQAATAAKPLPLPCLLVARPCLPNSAQTAKSDFDFLTKQVCAAFSHVQFPFSLLCQLLGSTKSRKPYSPLKRWCVVVCSSKVVSHLVVVRVTRRAMRAVICKWAMVINGSCEFAKHREARTSRPQIPDFFFSFFVYRIQGMLFVMVSHVDDKPLATASMTWVVESFFIAARICRFEACNFVSRPSSRLVRPGR